MIDFKRLLCLKELLSLTVMCLSRDTAQCSLANCKFSCPHLPLLPLPSCHSQPSSQQEKAGMFVGEGLKQAHPQYLQRDGGLLKLCLLVGWQVNWIFQRELSSSFTQLHNWKYNERNFLETAFSLQTQLPRICKAVELNPVVYANISASIYVALIISL